ncbi:MAG TPA: hypothetical protein P5079_07700 [Elusimicrobiota bacterium]|nr:hypothetical protein [Elusimicrobiota bacterium]
MDNTRGPIDKKPTLTSWAWQTPEDIFADTQRILQEGDMLLSLQRKGMRMEEEIAHLRRRLSELQTQARSQEEVRDEERKRREEEVGALSQKYERIVLDYRQELETLRKVLEHDKGVFEKQFEGARGAWRQEQAVELEKLRQAYERELEEHRAGMGRLEAERRREKKTAEDVLSAAQNESRRLAETVAAKEKKIAELQAGLEEFRKKVVRESVPGPEEKGRPSAVPVPRTEPSVGRGDLGADFKELWQEERAQWKTIFEKEKELQSKWLDNVLQDHQAVLEERRHFAEALKIFSQGVAEWGRREADAALRPKKESGSWRPTPSAGFGAMFFALCLGVAGTMLLRRSDVPAGVYSVPTIHAGGVVSDGKKVWFSDWSDGRFFVAPSIDPAAALSAGRASEGYHPVSLRLVGGQLWSLDAWGKTLHRHNPKPPFEIVESKPFGPVAAPSDFAWDGKSFWILDKDARQLLRFSPEELTRPQNVVSLPADWQLELLDFWEGDFWSYDVRSLRVKRFRVQPELRLVDEFQLPGAPQWLSGLNVSDGFLWVLSEKSQTIQRWSLKKLALRKLLGAS